MVIKRLFNRRVNSSKKQLEVLMHLEASTSEMLPISQGRKGKMKKKLFWSQPESEATDGPEMQF